MEYQYTVTVEVKKTGGKWGEVETVEGTIETEKTHIQVMDILSQIEKHKPERFTFIPDNASCTITSIFSHQIVRCREKKNIL